MQDCTGVAKISDDLIISGTNTANTNKQLEKVLARLKDGGLTLIKVKCVFHMPDLPFFGVVLITITSRLWSNQRESQSS